MTRTSPADRQDESELVTGVLGIYRRNWLLAALDDFRNWLMREAA